MNREALERLTKEELIDLILLQAEQLKQLQADFEALKLKFEHNQKPPTTSKNSSQPPSRDQKGNASKDKRLHRHGPPKGHAKHIRPFVAQPDHIVHLRKQRCDGCQADLSAVDGHLSKVNQITELPDAKAQVIEVRQYKTDCPECGQVQVAEPPAGLEMERAFGARLEATVVYFRQEQHLSYVRTQTMLASLYGVTISPGGIDAIMQRAGQRAVDRMEAIEEQVRQSPVVYCDETLCRVSGDNWWEWVFCTLEAVRHVIRFNRSVDVIGDVMKAARAEVWVSDCLPAQLKAPSQQRQLCLAHQIRNLQAVIDRAPPAMWATTMQSLFRYAIHLHHQREHLSPQAFQAKVAWLEQHLRVLLEQPLTEPAAGKLRGRYREHRDSLLVFLHRTDVEPTNNRSERALRPSVIHRKVLNGFRSGWGAQAYAALASVIDTAELKSVHAFDAIQSVIGIPALPLPVRG
ncbi:MAG TPA: IS66 family transposase [Anaerolineaceae bacterium]|nr:IS66 family transposase [Anaerolineaceae bacterium]